MLYSDNVRVLIDNTIYNIGDVVIGEGPYKDQRKRILEDDFYQHTFLRKYLNKFSNSNSRRRLMEPGMVIDTFSELEHTARLKVDPNAVYLHLRVGDVVCVSGSEDPLNGKFFKRINIRNISRVCKKVSELCTNCDKIVVITAFQYSYAVWNHSKDSMYENMDLFNDYCLDLKKKTGLPISFIDSPDVSDIELIDIHLYHLCMSNAVIPDVGEFNRVAKICRKFNHG